MKFYTNKTKPRRESYIFFEVKDTDIFDRYCVGWLAKNGLFFDGARKSYYDTKDVAWWCYASALTKLSKEEETK
jgi:hypothetical protein